MIKIEATQEEALNFLGSAFRNIDLPTLSSADLGDIAVALSSFAARHREQATASLREEIGDLRSALVRIEDATRYVPNEYAKEAWRIARAALSSALGEGRMDAETIARGLNEAQCEAIRLWDDRSDEDRLRRMLAILTNEDMSQIRALGLANKASLHKGITSVLTPLGLQVRALLKDRNA